MVHSIRLREPWEFKALGPEGRGPFRHSRRFHQPTGLEPTSKIWLVVEEVPGEADVTLNGQIIGKIGDNEYSARIDVTSAIKPNNLLEIAVWADAGLHGFGLARLEIEESEAPSKTTGQQDLAQRHRGTEE